MAFLRLIGIVTLLLLPVVSQAPASSQSLPSGSVEFTINFDAPGQISRSRAEACELAVEGRNLQISSSEGNSSVLPLKDGGWNQADNFCRFTSVSPINPAFSQTITYYQLDLFTISQDELEGKNVLNIYMTDTDSWGYDLDAAGEIQTAETPTPRTRTKRLPSPSPTPSPDEGDLNFSLTPQVDGVARAEIVIFSNVRESALFTEPVAMTFIAYEFESTESAEAGFVTLCQNAEDGLQGLTEAKYLGEVSIGRTGDERCAFNVDEPDSAMSLWAVVRSGDQVLVTLAIGLGGDYPEYVGEFLESYFDEFEGFDRFIMPELADLPRGWEGTRPPDDVTEETQTGQ